MASLFIVSKDIPQWLAAMAKTRKVFATQRESGAIIFKPYDPGREVVFERESVTSCKEAVFPQTKVLFSYFVKKNPETGETAGVAIEESLNKPAPQAVVFGTRPCGTKGFLTFDRVFDCDRIRDPYYTSLRERTAFITLACDRPGATCFCHWVGGAPDDPKGSDALLTPVEGGFLVEAVTEKGEELVNEARSLFAEADEKRREEGAAVRDKAKGMLTPKPDLTDIGPALEKRFRDLDFWEDMTAACVSCNMCTYLCPTCYCFNITDESDGQAGVRLRTWDACMSQQYSLEASGHNPRPTRAHRMRNRVNHKFWYHPKEYGGVISCCGCGRCVKHCPGSVDIRRILLTALERKDEDAE